MRFRIATICSCLFASITAHASDSINSEAGHFAGGVLWGGVTAWAVDRYWPEQGENRVVIGFAVATTAGIIGEIHDSIHGHPKKFSALDAVSAALGGAVGAVATDRWILQPVVKTGHGARYYGLSSQYNF